MRIANIEELPASELKHALNWLELLQKRAFEHWRSMQAYEREALSRFGIPLLQAA